MLAGHPRDPGHLHAAGPAALPRAAGRRRAVGHRASDTPCSRSPKGWRRRSSSAATSSAAIRAGLILGDNIFYGHGLARVAAARRAARPRARRSSATPVQGPGALRRGRVRRDGRVGRASRRSPPQPKSHYAVTGLYFYDDQVLRHRRARCKPSARGELEITDVNRELLDAGSCSWRCSAAAWPGSTPARTRSLHEAANFIETIEQRQGLKIACPEEIAYRMGFIDAAQLRAPGASRMAKNGVRPVPAGMLPTSRAASR